MIRLAYESMEWMTDKTHIADEANFPLLVRACGESGDEHQRPVAT